jgi:hypothetical protein
MQKAIIEELKKFFTDSSTHQLNWYKFIVLLALLILPFAWKYRTDVSEWFSSLTSTEKYRRKLVKAEKDLTRVASASFISLENIERNRINFDNTVGTIRKNISQIELTNRTGDMRSVNQSKSEIGVGVSQLQEIYNESLQDMRDVIDTLRANLSESDYLAKNGRERAKNKAKKHFKS